MSLPLIPLITSIAFKPYVLTAGVISGIDLACQGTSYIFPRTTNFSACKLSKNIIKGFFGTLNTAATTSETANNFFSASTELAGKGTKTLSSILSDFKNIYTKAFDQINNPYTPYLLTGAAVAVIGVYTLIKTTDFIDKHKHNSAKRQSLEAETHKREAEARRAEAEVAIPKAEIAKINLEMKLIEADILKKNYEIQITKVLLRKEAFDAKLKEFEFKKKNQTKSLK